MGIGTWFHNVGATVAAPIEAIGNTILGWFSTDEKAIIDFFTPLLEQVRAQALIIGKNDLAAGLQVIKDAAMAAVIAAENAPAGQKVAMAEAEFLTVAASEGITAVNNAEAAAIKAAVAIIQTTPNFVANTTPPANT